MMVDLPEPEGPQRTRGRTMATGDVLEEADETGDDESRRRPWRMREEAGSESEYLV
jgi:hypothetical protein